MSNRPVMSQRPICQFSLVTAILTHISEVDGDRKLSQEQLNTVVACCDTIVDEFN